MSNDFKKLMREQVQEKLNDFAVLTKQSIPIDGWIRTIRDALGMSSYVLAQRLGCAPSNISTMEKREKQGSITLETLEQVAQAMNCKLVYCLIPLEPLDKMLERQARIVAKKKIRLINHSMKLEEQGLNPQQLQRQEEELVKELLQGNSKKLWNDDEL